jgi:hypothetical protein
LPLPRRTVGSPDHNPPLPPAAGTARRPTLPRARVAGALSLGRRRGLGRALGRHLGVRDGRFDDGGHGAVGGAGRLAHRRRQLDSSHRRRQRGPWGRERARRALLARAVLQRRHPVHGRESRLPPRHGSQVVGRLPKMAADLSRGACNVCRPPSVPLLPGTLQGPRAHCIAARQPECLRLAPPSCAAGVAWPLPCPTRRTGACFRRACSGMRWPTRSLRRRRANRARLRRGTIPRPSAGAASPTRCLPLSHPPFTRAPRRKVTCPPPPTSPAPPHLPLLPPAFPPPETLTPLVQRRPKPPSQVYANSKDAGNPYPVPAPPVPMSPLPLPLPPAMTPPQPQPKKPTMPSARRKYCRSRRGA